VLQYAKILLYNIILFTDNICNFHRETRTLICALALIRDMSSSFIRLNMDYWNRNIQQSINQKLPFTRMILSVHATDSSSWKCRKRLFLLLTYAKRKAKSRPRAVRKLKLKQNARVVTQVYDYSKLRNECTVAL